VVKPLGVEDEEVDRSRPVMVTEIVNSSLPEQLIVLIIAALPVVELRGSLPVAMGILHMPWYQSFALSLIGNLLPVPFLLLFYDSLARLVCRMNRGRKLMEWLYERTRRQTWVIEKYKHVGLVLLVAIPLPGTGAWTASIAAHLLGMKFRHAFLDIVLGVILSGLIVTTLVLFGWIGAGIAFAGLILLVVASLWRHARPET
jgi:uncharacterized membrane protein